jgi:hypothetical protein
METPPPQRSQGTARRLGGDVSDAAAGDRSAPGRAEPPGAHFA